MTSPNPPGRPARQPYPTRRPEPTTPVAPPRPTRSPTRVNVDAEIEAYVNELVAAAPPFTREQEDRLRAIFAPAYERVAVHRAAASAA